MTAAPVTAGSWKSMPLGECVDILDRRRVPVNKTERSQRLGDVPYYGATGQVGWIDDFLFDEELVLLGEDGAPFLERGKPKAYLVSGKSWVNNHAHVLRGKAGLLNSRFLCHYLNTVGYEEYVSGTTRLKLPQRTMREIQIPVPTLDEQEAIVTQIEVLFDDIAAGRSSLEQAGLLVGSCRQSALNSLVYGRHFSSTPRLSQDGAVELPEGWQWGKLQDVATLVQYGTSEKAITKPTSLPVMRMGNVRDGRIVTSGLKYMPDDWPEADKYLLDVGDILFNRTNSPELVGKAAVYEGQPGRAVFASYLIRVRVDTDKALPRFIAHCVNSAFGRAYIASVVSQQVGQANVNGTKLKAFPVPLAPLSDQATSVCEVEGALEGLKVLNTEVKWATIQSDRMKQSILRAAFSGQLV